MKDRVHVRWLALAALVGASTVGLAPSAGAYQPGGQVPTLDVVNCTAAAAGNVAPDPIDVPTVTFGANGQAAGCWAIQADPGEARENGDQVLIAVDDALGLASAGGVRFSSVPTVKLGSQTLTNVTLASGNAGLQVVVTGLSAPTVADMVITNVKYDVDFKGAPSNTAYGPVSVVATLNGSPVIPGPLTDSFGEGANAFVSDVTVSANDPEVGLDAKAFPGAATAPISDIVVREAGTAALPAGTAQTICIDTGASGLPVTNPDTVDFTAADVTRVSGDATAVGIAVSPNQLRLTYTIPATRTAANTFKVTGIRADVATEGRILVTARRDGNNDCASVDGDRLTPATGVTTGAVIDQDRTGGSDRFETARRIAEDWFGPTDAAIIARGDDFADALAASGLAGKVASDLGADVPVLLTQTNAIPSATLNALASVKTVYIVGGTQAVSQQVEDQLRNKPAPGSGVFCPGSSTTECLRVVRIAGTDRYGTAREIADFMGAAGTVDLDETDGLADAAALRTAFLARGDVFADALAVGPLAYQGALGPGFGDGGAMPILLTRSDALSPAAQAALVDLGIRQVVIVGGTAAVSDAVKGALEAMGIAVVRVGGVNRQHTAGLIAGMALGASFAFSSGPVTGEFILARGDTFPDALAAGPLGGFVEAPIVLTESPTTLGAFTTGVMDLTSALVVPNLIVVGQTAAVSDTAATAARNALSGTTLPQ